MMSRSPFELPNELLISSLCTQYPGREAQIRTLSTLLSSYFFPPKNIVLYGLEATGKSDITLSLLLSLSSPDQRKGTKESVQENDAARHLKFAIVKSEECVTGRHLLENTVAAIATAVDWKRSVGRCETVAQLAVETSRLLSSQHGNMDPGAAASGSEPRFFLVFDGIDRQRDAPSTLLPGLARLGETISNLTAIFIVTSPRPHFLRISSVPHLYFPAYTKAEAFAILSLNVPPMFPITETEPPDAKEQKKSSDLWSRFVSAVWDSLSKHSGRDVLSLRSTCIRLWPTFTSLIRHDHYGPKDFIRLLIANRPLFQDESLLVSSITTSYVPSTSTTTSMTSSSRLKSRKDAQSKPNKGIVTQLPVTPRLLLIAAYLASYTPARLDLSLFSKSSIFAKKRRRKAAASTTSQSQNTTSRTGVKLKHRKIPRTLLGPQAFVLERLLAIFAAIKLESSVGRGYLAAGLTADVPMAIATLTSLRLLIRTGVTGDLLEAGTKYRVNVGWEIIRGLARSVGVEVEDFIVE